jgi:hypothetical protein
MVFSEDLDFCIPVWKNPNRARRCKWSLLKGRERKYKGSTVGAGGVCRQTENVLLFFRCF